jgi:dienelactone hydrolase
LLRWQKVEVFALVNNVLPKKICPGVLLNIRVNFPKIAGETNLPDKPMNVTGISNEPQKHVSMKTWYSLFAILILFSACSHKKANKLKHIPSLQTIDKPYGQLTKLETDTTNVRHWPFLVYTPSEERIKHKMPVILFVPNNSGKATDNFDWEARQAIKDARSMAPELTEELPVIYVTSIFPRPLQYERWRIYTQALDRDVMTTEHQALSRLDLQAIEAINEIKDILKKRWDIKTGSKIAIMGFSAAGMFANRFTALHPELVKAAVVGSPGGWPIAPQSEWEGKVLRYPVGTADFKELTGETFNLEAFQKIPMLFFIGSDDTNDSVPYDDGYDKADQDLIFTLFGKDMQQRWAESEKLYQADSTNATFKTYEGVGHKVTDRMKQDAILFLKENLQ